ncbi:MAG TPA: PDZ domain-containing protein [Candidatus Baltobacteraceae bacterium]
MAAALALIPTPYSLILPGRALDLRDVIRVAGHAPPRAHFYMTDVAFIPHATPITLLDGLAPGVRVVRTEDVVPRGVTGTQYDVIMREAMSESQEIAAVVAERAAHLRVPAPHSHVVVLYFSALSRAREFLRAGDLIVAVNGRPVTATADIARALAHVVAGKTVAISVSRDRRRRLFRVPTIAYNGATALGVYLTSILDRPRLPVAVNYHLPNVSGSSGGLMFALEIYRSLSSGGDSGARIAGTGTISWDGTIGPIEGAPQKVVAARRAGATEFLVPRENYSEVRATGKIRIVPVSTFAQALAALR